MTTWTDDDRSTPWLALLVGALIAVIVAIGYLIYSGADSARAMRLGANLPTTSDSPRPQADTAPLPKPAQ